MTMRFEDLEQVYEAMASGMDAAGPEREQVFLAKLCLLLAHRLGDLEQFEACCRTASAVAELRRPD